MHIMRLTDILAWPTASHNRSIMYHDVTRQQTAFSMQDGPAWRVQGWKQYKQRVMRPGPVKRYAPSPSEHTWLAPIAFTPAPRPTPSAAAQVRPLRPCRGRVPAGLDRTNLWV